MAADPFAFHACVGARCACCVGTCRPAAGADRLGVCGDLHLSNFGVLSRAEPTRVFDLNDFDEAATTCRVSVDLLSVLAAYGFGAQTGACAQGGR